MYSDAIPPVDSMISFQKRVNELKDRGKNLADYEIQHTKTGFQLRNRNSFLTKISKFLHPEQYNLAKNVQELALGARHHAGRTDLQTMNPEAIHKALTTILTKQIRSASPEGAWGTTQVALRALGTDLFENERKKIDPLREKLHALGNALRRPGESLHDTLQLHLPELQTMLKEHKKENYNPRTLQPLEGAWKDIYQQVHTLLDDQNNLPYYQYEQMIKELHLLNANFQELLPGSELPPEVTKCFEALAALAHEKTGSIMDEMDAFLQAAQQSQKKDAGPLDADANPFDAFIELSHTLPKKLEALTEDEREHFQKDPKFQQLRDSVFRFWTDMPMKERIRSTDARVDLVTLKGPQVNPLTPPEGEKSKAYRHANALIEKWLPLFPNSQAILDTFGREDIDAISIENEYIDIGAMAPARKTYAALQGEDVNFRQRALIALTAEAVFNRIVEVRKLGSSDPLVRVYMEREELSNTEIQNIQAAVVTLFSTLPIEVNPISLFIKAFHDFQAATVRPGETQFAFSSPLTKQPRRRYAFDVHLDPLKPHYGSREPELRLRTKRDFTITSPTGEECQLYLDGKVVMTQMNPRFAYASSSIFTDARHRLYLRSNPLEKQK